MTAAAATNESDVRERSNSWLGDGAFLVVYAVVFLLILPQALSTFQLNLLGRFLTYAIVAVGLDMLWGYTGMMSLGHGLWFGLGAYCFGMYLNLEAVGERLPDFMGLYGVTELPWLWLPFRSPVVAIALAVIVPMVGAGLLGYMVFRSRVQGVYFLHYYTGAHGDCGAARGGPAAAHQWHERHHGDENDLRGETG